METPHYDYLISGAGMAGLSLAYAICHEPELRSKKILLVDSDSKTQNDRTWAYWEKGVGRFDELVFRKWDEVAVTHPNHNKIRVSMAPYQYKLIRGADFYRAMREFLGQQPQVTWIQDRVLDIGSNAQHAWIQSTHQRYSGDLVFDSTFRPAFNLPYRNHLWQHFKGYVIEMNQEVFDHHLPDIMDFSVPQVDDECTFLYVIPFSKTKALVELTFFSEPILTQEKYTELLEDLIEKKWPGVAYQVEEEEFGIIPMSDTPFQEIVTHRHVRIGTAGGYTQPATGFTFALTQERLGEIVHQLKKGQTPTSTRHWARKRMEAYAAILLNVLKWKRYAGQYFFPELFLKNPAHRVFAFLSGHTRWIDEIKVMNTAPWIPFILASFHLIWNRLKEKLS